MLSEEQIKRLIELRKEEMVLISRKTDFEKNDNIDYRTKNEIERINIRLNEIEAEISKIKDLPKAITRNQLAKELEESNRTEEEIIEEHTKNIEKNILKLKSK